MFPVPPLSPTDRSSPEVAVRRSRSQIAASFATALAAAILIVAMLGSGASAREPSPDQARQSSGSTAQVVGGTDAEDGEFPYMISLQRLEQRFKPAGANGTWGPWETYDPDNTIDDLGEHTCGATLIAPRRALTAAHCVYNFQNSTQEFVQRKFEILIGRTQLTDTSVGETRRVVRVDIPEDYNPGSFFEGGEDIAVLHLDAPVEGVRIVPLVGLESEDIQTWTFAPIVVGWGATDPNMIEPSDILQKGRTQPYLPDCSLYGPYGEYLCAFGTGNAPGGSTANQCSGDSGGPALIVNPRARVLMQTGVISGSNCTAGNNSTFMLQTSVDKHAAFLTCAAKVRVYEISPDPVRGPLVLGEVAPGSLVAIDDRPTLLEGPSLLQSRCEFVADAENPADDDYIYNHIER